MSIFCKFIIQENQLTKFGGIKKETLPAVSACVGAQAKRDNLDVYP